MRLRYRTFDESPDDLRSLLPSGQQALRQEPAHPLLDDDGGRLHLEVLLALPVAAPAALDDGCNVVLLYLVGVFRVEQRLGEADEDLCAGRQLSMF